MEQLLHYCWKHRLFPLGQLVTTKGKSVEILSPGLHNTNSPGPDFFNAKLRIDGTIWVGNIEIHQRASHWYQHHHDTDSAYDNVILHVCGVADTEVVTHNGHRPPQMEMLIPAYVADNYQQLFHIDRYPPCYQIISQLSPLLTHAWMTALQTERLEQKTQLILKEAQDCRGDWEQTFFITMARSFGFGHNADTMQQWARSLPLNILAHQRDDEMQTEALFIGQAGMLQDEALTDRKRQQAQSDEHYRQLQNEYNYLRHKYNLTPIDPHLWQHFRLRPQNFPLIRINQLMNLYRSGRLSLRALTEQDNVDSLVQLWQTKTTPYWSAHYSFGKKVTPTEKCLTRTAIETLIINTAVPMLFAYGRHTANDTLCDKAFDMLEQLKPEDNHIVRLWAECGLKAHHAGDSQALIQLKKQYCDRRECLRCRIGYEYMRHNNAADLFSEEKPTD